MPLAQMAILCKRSRNVILSQKSSVKWGKIRSQTKHEEDKKMSVLNITKENFENEVVKSEKVVLLDFFATWCGPCRMVGPIIDEIAEENEHIVVGKVDVDAQTELATKFQVYSIPTLVVLKNGEVLKQSTGAKSKAQILAMLP